jgi:hypothetical protein
MRNGRQALHDQTIQLKKIVLGLSFEIIAKVTRTSARIYELGISCNGRTYREGKKSTAKTASEPLCHS